MKKTHDSTYMKFKNRIYLTAVVYGGEMDWKRGQENFSEATEIVCVMNEVFVTQVHKS